MGRTTGGKKNLVELEACEVRGVKACRASSLAQAF